MYWMLDFLVLFLFFIDLFCELLQIWYLFFIFMFGVFVYRLVLIFLDESFYIYVFCQVSYGNEFRFCLCFFSLRLREMMRRLLRVVGLGRYEVGVLFSDYQDLVLFFIVFFSWVFDFFLMDFGKSFFVLFGV